MHGSVAVTNMERWGGGSGMMGVFNVFFQSHYDAIMYTARKSRRVFSV